MCWLGVLLEGVKEIGKAYSLMTDQIISCVVSDLLHLPNLIQNTVTWDQLSCKVKLYLWLLQDSGLQ